MNVENMTDKNVIDASILFDEMKKQNPDLSYEIYSQSEKPELTSRVDLIEESVENLSNNIDELKQLLKHIFGNHVLINGQFKTVFSNDVKNGI